MYVDPDHWQLGSPDMSKPIFCGHTQSTHTHTMRDASEIKPVHSSQSPFKFLYLLTSHSPLQLSLGFFSAAPTPPSLLFIYPPLTLHLPFLCLPSYTCPSCLPFTGSPLSLFFFLPVTTFPGLIANLSAGKCFVTSR